MARIGFICFVVICAVVSATADTPSYSYQEFAFPGAANTQLFGINNSGSVIGHSDNGAFLYANGNFTSISVPGADATVALGINDLGQIVGYYLLHDSWQTHGFLFSSSMFTTIDIPGTGWTELTGINNAGQITGISDSGGAVFSSGTWSAVQVPGGTAQWVHALNDKGDVAGTYVACNGGCDTGYAYIGGQLVVLATGWDARAINDRGTIGGVAYVPIGDGEYDYRGFVIADGSTQVFDNTSIVNGLNDNGQWVGTQYRDDGTEVGVVATPIPEPSCAILVSSALAILSFAARKKIR